MAVRFLILNYRFETLITNTKNLKQLRTLKQLSLEITIYRFKKLGVIYGAIINQNVKMKNSKARRWKCRALSYFLNLWVFEG